MGIKKRRRLTRTTIDEAVAVRDVQLLRALQQLPENQLSKTILKPLFVALGFNRVEFYGGSNEGGKDLICTRQNELGETELTCVQVKKYKPSAKARDKQSFGELVTQLSQAFEKEVPTLDGNAMPNRVFLITPYIIDTRALSMRFEGYMGERTRGMRIIDGAQL